MLCIFVRALTAVVTAAGTVCLKDRPDISEIEALRFDKVLSFNLTYTYYTVAQDILNHNWGWTTSQTTG